MNAGPGPGASPTHATDHDPDGGDEPVNGPHPAVDVVTDRVAVIIQERPVVSLTTWIADTVRICAATGRALQLVTPRTSRLTVPLRLVLDGPDVRWVARADGGYYDGLTGRSLRWSGSAFQPDGTPGTPRIAAAYARPEPPRTWQIMAQLWVGHAATEATVLGESVARLCAGLTGTPPRGFGAAEPATQRWDPSSLTQLCRERAPRPTRLVLVGDHAVGALTVRRYAEGIDEVTTLVSAAPRIPSSRDLAALAADLAVDRDLRMLIIQARPGRADLTHPAAFEAPPFPVAALAGRQVIGRRGITHAVAADVRAAKRVGPGRTTVWYQLWAPGDDASAGWRRLTRLLGHLGEPVPGYLDPTRRTWGGFERAPA